MAQSRIEKLGKSLDKLATASKKDDRLKINIVKASELKDIEFIKTGLEPFDTAIGGIPRGRFSLWFGGSGVGKSTTMLQAAGNIARQGKSVLIMEPENRKEKKWWTRFMNMDDVYVSSSTSLGDSLDSLIQIAATGTVDVIFVDSLAALAVKEMRGKGTEGDHMALVARRMPQFFQNGTQVVEESGTAVVFIHQKRDVLEMYSSELETYNGGNALKHQVSLVVNFRRGSTSRDPDKGERFKGPDGKKLGFMTNLKCIKGTVGTITEGQNIQQDFFYGKGFVNASSIPLYAMRTNIIEKLGPGQYTFSDSKGETYTQRGVMNVINDVTEDEDLKNRVLSAIQNKLYNDIYDTPVIEPDAEFETEEARKIAEEEKALETSEETEAKNIEPQIEEPVSEIVEESKIDDAKEETPKKSRGRKKKS